MHNSDSMFPTDDSQQPPSTNTEPERPLPQPTSEPGGKAVEPYYQPAPSPASIVIIKSKTLTPQQRQMIQAIADSFQVITQQLQKRIVGLKEVIEQLLICIFSGNHALLVGVPGLAKTLLIRSLADLLDLKFSRIQFTPDLMPSDITGSEILVQEENTKVRQFTFLQGPIFANIILADEINRTPPKTQAALLEAMEERTVTSIGRRMVLTPPFFVLATQNPIEQEGTYPLPAAQLDRFMFNLLLDYPFPEEEYRIMRLTVSSDPVSLAPVLSQDKILELLSIVKRIEIPSSVMHYAIELVRSSRPQNASAPQSIKDFVAWGASPRAAQGLIIGAKTRAMLHGRANAEAADIRTIMHAVMRHRIILNYRAEADGITPDEIIDALIANVPAPDGITKHRRRRKYAQKLYLAIQNR